MAGFNTAVTGLKAASTLLDVTGNNIANSSTVGFKSSRTEFGDIYATAVVGAGSANVVGSGVLVTDIAQDFKAGTIEFTNNNLDLAINGSGFFILDDGQGGISYTRSGAFELDKDGFIKSKTDKYVQGFALDGTIGNLAVTEKESKPQATNTIDLSFNIDAREDSSTLLPTYSKDEPGSFTYTTTMTVFDSVGDQHTIKYNLAEQRPVRQVYEFDIDSGYPKISGVQLSAADFTGNALNETSTGYQLLSLADDRIDLSSLQFDSTSGNLSFELHAWATDAGDLIVKDDTDANALQLNTNVKDQYRDANESRTYDISIADGTGAADDIGAAGEIVIAGVRVPISETDDAQEIAQAIKNREAVILDTNPDIESIIIDTSGSQASFTIKFKAGVGDVDDSEYAPRLNINTAPTAASVTIGDQTIAGPVTDQLVGFTSVIQGDNSFQGNYRVYAYLDNDTLLNLGKLQDPGEGLETEPGPILIRFDPTNGILTSVNGQEFPAGAQVPSVTITVDGNDQFEPISLDLTGTTQFASASIVKNMQQNGYTKGDLIGVTFGQNGEMIASFSNGQKQALGTVAIATFENQAGLQPSGNTEWQATLTSGNATPNRPGTALAGTLRSAALEQSNVDLSAELVKLIEGQRNFQANSKTLETLNTVTQAILQI